MIVSYVQCMRLVFFLLEMEKPHVPSRNSSHPGSLLGTRNAVWRAVMTLGTVSALCAGCPDHQSFSDGSAVL